MARIKDVLGTRYVVYTYVPGQDAHWERGPWYVNLAIACQQVKFYLAQGIAAVIETESHDLAS